MTATNQLGIRQNNVVVPYTAANIRTKWIDITSNITCTSFTATSAKAMFYADSNSQWVMKVNIVGSFSVAVNNPAFTISGISSIAAAQSLLCTATDGSGLDIVIGECTLASSSNVITAYGIGIKNSISISNDVLLSANPTAYTTTANMEGVTACDVYIQPATATTAGVVDTGTQVWAGAKTHNGVLTIANTTDATSTLGALVVEGGVCVKKKLYVTTGATIASLSSAGIVHNDSSGVLSTSLIVNNDISGSAAIADSKLATISTAGKVSNSATTATNANTASAIVARDGSGNFSAGTITATLSGTSSRVACNNTSYTNLTTTGQTITTDLGNYAICLRVQNPANNICVLIVAWGVWGGGVYYGLSPIAGCTVSGYEFTLTSDTITYRITYNGGTGCMEISTVSGTATGTTQIWWTPLLHN